MLLVSVSLPGILTLLHSWWEIGIIAGGLALWLAVQTGREKLRVYRSRSWPTSVGTVENIRVRKVDGGLNGVDYWKVSFDYTYRIAQEHAGEYSFNCVSEAMANGAVAGMTNKTVCVRYNPSDESKGLLWEDEVWDIWWDTYWKMANGDDAALAK